MKLNTVNLILLLSCLASVCASQTGERAVDMVPSCSEGTVIKAVSQGVASISLASNKTLWKAMSNHVVDLGPVVAGDAVAVLTNSWSTVYVFSKSTGKPLWHKECWSCNLASDGNYLYLNRVEYWDLQALDPASGKVLWSLKLPGQGPGFPWLLGVHNGLLFTSQSAVDLSRRKVVHFWRHGPGPTSTWINEAGEIVIGDSAGGITIYDRSFRPLRRMHVAAGEVVQAVTTKTGILAAAYQDYVLTKRGMITFMATDGGSWQQSWRLSSSSDPYLAPLPFTVVGDSVLMIEPDGTHRNLRLTLRQLATGKLIWTTRSGFLDGPVVVCGETVYLEDFESIRSFDLQNGVEKTPAK